MERNRALETDQCIHGHHMRKRVPQFNAGKHGLFGDVIGAGKRGGKAH